MKKEVCFIMAFLLCSLGVVFAREHTANDTLMVKVYVANDHIKLRWAPGNRYLWEDGLQYGYRLIRKTITRNGELLEVPEVLVLKERILPTSEEQWKKAMTTDAMVAVVAQAIHGQSFLTSGGGGLGTAAQVIMETDELTKRYAFSLYACDMSFTAAELAGLAFTDHAVDPNEGYLYQLQQHTPDHKVGVSGMRFVNASERTVLPVPQPPAAIAIDSTIRLSWNYTSLAKTYTAYVIERSQDGINYRPPGTTPVTALSMDASGNITYSDTPEAFGLYRYRLRGVNVFGITGPPSEGFEVALNPPFTTRARIVGHESYDGGEISLSWKFETPPTTALKELKLYASSHPHGTYNEIRSGIDKDAGAIHFKQKGSVAYYKLHTVDQYQQSLESPAYFVQLPDTIPPENPVGLKAIIGDDSRINLSWQGVAASDLLGYDIYFAPSKGAAFSRLNKAPIESPDFVYVLQKKNSLQHARFMVRAVDERYNQSIPSDTVTLSFAIPPVAPVINHYQYELSKGLILRWSVYEQGDNSLLRLYRQDKELAAAGKWELLTEIDIAQATTYTDSGIHAGKTYRYIMTALNTHGQESAPSEVFTFTVPGPRPAIDYGRLTLTANREYRAIRLHWNFDVPGLLEVRLYRRKGGEKLSLYKTLKGEAKTFTDTEVAPNNAYGYLLVGLYPGGERRSLEEETINF
ncbi:fibronectin type III domain-containing protein [Robertkochia sediminum]|uniref:fibronectin type III domain-containing protein n=1 Tax=Robertkochia sediminum TaxID=2785326 RepID=UPI0019311BE2|nr:fibronectin type III domain-containing protein [Robertkochia sediminum]MBL7472084.1 fibronectin type III domain-containing protein [Robertkochia sediminum]